MQMKFIGITGGVGAGKTEILSYLENMPQTRVMLADQIAHDLMKPGTECYRKIRDAFETDQIFRKDGTADRMRMAAVIFTDAEKRGRMNAIVHPAVRAYVEEILEEEHRRGELKLLVLEAALLIEEHYDEICDELWYIYTREEIRAQRLAESRGYPPEKIRQIFDSQLAEETYKRHCTVIIDNNGTVEETYRQIDSAVASIKYE